MLSKAGWLLCALVMAFVSVSSADDAVPEKPFSLMVGDPAPPLPATKWLRGSPVEEFQKGQVYVVDLWSTWCPPCIKAFPHLSELQAKYGDAVTIIGASIWEMQPETVPGFVKAQGENIRFSICQDFIPEGKEANQGVISEQWYYGSGSEGVPTVFIIDQESRIAWIGHAEIDEPLARVVDGTWDLAGERKSYLAGMVEEAEFIRLRYLIDDAIVKQDWVTAVTGIDVLLEADHDKHSEDAGNFFGMIAGTIASPGAGDQDLDIALSSAKAAIELTKEKHPYLYSTLAQVHFLRGEMVEAVRAQAQAVDVADEQSKEDFQSKLDEYMASEEYKASSSWEDFASEDSFSAFDTPPEPVKTVAPNYPESMKRVGTTGTSHVEVTIDAGGEVVAARIIKSTAGEYLDVEAIKAAKKWLFKPAKANGKPVKAKIVIPFEFKLN